MPILGKRKYINEKIEKLINKLDMMGYDTTRIKRRFYEYEEEDDEEGSGKFGGLPYRDKINETLELIEELINYNQTDTSQYYNQTNTPPQYTPQQTQFKNNLIERVTQPQSQPQPNNSFNLF